MTTLNEDWIEIEGSSRAEAIERACNALNTSTPYLHYETLEEGRRTKIRARKLEHPATPAPRRPSPVEPVEDPRDDEQPRNFGPRSDERDEHPRDDDRFEEDPRNARSREEAAPPRAPRPAVVQESVEPTETGKGAQEALKAVVAFIDTEAQVDLNETKDEIQLEIRGERAGLMIGKHGNTLQALQHLVSKMLHLDGPGDETRKRVVVDAEHYWARRRESVEDLAHKLAERARRERRPISARPMNALERRIMHMALLDHPHVTTKSVGEGLDRKVVICPKRGGGRPDSGNGDREGNREGGRGRGRGRSGSGGSGGGGRGGRGGRRGGRTGLGATRPAGEESGGFRRSGPPARLHDSFDAPPEPSVDVFSEDPDAPIMTGNRGEEGEGSSEE